MRTQSKRLGPERATKRSALAKPDIAALAERFAEPLPGDVAARTEVLEPPIPERVRVSSANSVPEPIPQVLLQPSQPEPPTKCGLAQNAFVTALVLPALVPLALLIFLLLQDMIRAPAGSGSPLAGAISTSGSVYVKKDTSKLTAEPGASETARAGAEVTGGLLYGAAGWSLSPDTASALPFWVPEQTGSPEMPAAASPRATETAAVAEPLDVAAVVPAPLHNPAPPARIEPPVRTVKVVAIEPPRRTRDMRPYDGAYALGAPAGEPQTSGEWMVTKTAVDMHARAEQNSETLKVAAGGLKVRVTARDKNWVQVYDPKSSTTGWIYNRFLKSAEAPAQ